MIEPALYLLPVPIADVEPEAAMPRRNIEIMSQIKFFIVENIRTARRWLKKADKEIDINSLTFFELNKHTKPGETADFLLPLRQGNAVGLMSEAGCPAIADPGAGIVALAQAAHMRVVPLVGPSSILLALMASGFNGQNFAFNGYLPIGKDERNKAIKHYERKAYDEGQTQIFIETPYRNNRMLADIAAVCRPATRLCVAANITCHDEKIVAMPVAEWKRKPAELPKVPCIFLISK